MKKWNLIIDIEKCHDCNNCFLACKDEYVGNDFLPYSIAQPNHGQRWMNIMRKERGQYPKVDIAYLPIPCMHCDDAPCIKGSKDGAAYKREDGIVIFDAAVCIGCKDCIDACPLGVVQFDDAAGVAQKCDLCADRLDRGLAPACVVACPSHCIYFGDVKEITERLGQQKLLVWYKAADSENKL